MRKLIRKILTAAIRFWKFFYRIFKWPIRISAAILCVLLLISAIFFLYLATRPDAKPFDDSDMTVIHEKPIGPNPYNAKMNDEIRSGYIELILAISGADYDGYTSFRDHDPSKSIIDSIWDNRGIDGLPANYEPCKHSSSVVHRPGAPNDAQAPDEAPECRALREQIARIEKEDRAKYRYNPTEKQMRALDLAFGYRLQK